MKKLLLLLLFIPLVSFGQDNMYYVSSEGGLNVRDKPGGDGKKIATLLVDDLVYLLEKTDISLTINDLNKSTGETKEISGQWIKIKTHTPPKLKGDKILWKNNDQNIEGYVFDGFIKKYIVLQFQKKYFLNYESESSKTISKKTEFESGRWISTTDSLAGIEIKNGKWIHFYKTREGEKTDVYEFKIARGYIKEIGAELEYLAITSDRSDPLKYAILEYSNELLSLSYIGRGNTLNYVPEKDKEEEKKAIEKESKDKDVNNFPGTDSYTLSNEGKSTIYDYNSYKIITTDYRHITGYPDSMGEQIKTYSKDDESVEFTVGDEMDEFLFRGIVQGFMILRYGGMSAPPGNWFYVFDLQNQKIVFDGFDNSGYQILNSKIEFYQVVDSPNNSYYAKRYGKFTKPKCSEKIRGVPPESIGYVEKFIYDIATQQLERTGVYECAYFQ